MRRIDAQSALSHPRNSSREATNITHKNIFYGFCLMDRFLHFNAFNKCLVLVPLVSVCFIVIDFHQCAKQIHWDWQKLVK